VDADMVDDLILALEKSVQDKNKGLIREAWALQKKEVIAREH
jgi:hypothetical protein